MGIEIERKFLVDCNLLELPKQSTHIIQGYLNDDPVTRIRCTNDASSLQAFLTIKSKRIGICCSEFEYEIPYDDGITILKMTTKIIEKNRYKILYDGFTWEIDVFSSLNKGLIIAEIELPEENTIFKQPEWATVDVSLDSKYYNCNLVSYPYSMW